MIRSIAFRSTPQAKKTEPPHEQTIWTGERGWTLKPENISVDTLTKNSPVGNAITCPDNLTGRQVVVNEKALDTMQVLHPYIAIGPEIRHNVFGDKRNPVTGIRTLKLENVFGQIESVNAAAFDVVPQDTPLPKKFNIKY